MFIGHFAAGFAAKKLDARPSLAGYFVAAQLPDILWPGFLLAGVERATIAPGDTAFNPLRFDSYPYSHSLLAVAAAGALLGAICAAWSGSRRAGFIFAALALSHWVLDFASHRPDMPLWPGGGPKLGLGLWNSVALTLIVEGLIFVAGVALYAQATRARDAVGRFGLAGLVALLLVFYLAAAFGPLPPSMTAVAGSALTGVPIVAALAWWVDRHRRPA
jgi:hypothetical protein